ncbi:MAG: hypothetical protein ABFD64_07470 [Armatimonadota bacterium]
MACYIISMDMPAGAEIDPVVEAIKSYGTWAHITESTWAVVSEKDHKQIRDHILNCLPQNSRIFIVKSGNTAAWNNVICRNEWLKENV